MSMADQLFFLLLSLLVVTAFVQVFVSIDCGGSSNIYTDEKGIKWSGDDPFIQTGKNAVVQTSNSNSISHVMNTLRVFSTHNKKNCYSINATNGEKKFLVRASFYYGNYDNKSSPPSFDLHFDGNKRTKVVTSSEELVSKVAVYNTKVDAISVCLAQTHPNQFPFISALEMRSLASAIDFHNDSINVNIPGFLGDLPNLKELNLLADNFSGSRTPSSHDTLTNPYFSPLDYFSPPPPQPPNVSVTVKSKKNPRLSTRIVAPVGCSGGVVLIVAIIVYIRHKDRKAKLAAATKTANDVKV